MAKKPKLDAETQAKVDAVKLKSLDFHNDATTGQGTIDLTMTDDHANGLLAAMGEAMLNMLDRGPAENYVEIECRPAAGSKIKGTFTMTIRRAEKPTPHQLRQKAERERDAALAEVADLKAELAAARLVSPEVAS